MAGRLQIVEQLGLLYRTDGLDSLEFHDDRTVADEVSTVQALERTAFVQDGECKLPSERDTALVNSRAKASW